MGEFLAFRKMITPVIIQGIFWLGVSLCIIIGLVQIIMGASAVYGGGAMILIGLITLFIGPLFVRIYCELLILLFRIYDELVAMRTGRAPEQPQGFGVLTSSAPPAAAQT
jgi:hypothetical protein